MMYILLSIFFRWGSQTSDKYISCLILSHTATHDNSAFELILLVFFPLVFHKVIDIKGVTNFITLWNLKESQRKYIYIYNIYLYFERESLCSSQILIFIRTVWSAFKSTNSSALLFRNSNFYGLGWLGVQGSLVLKEEVHISPFKKHCFNCVTKDIMSAIHIS